MRAFTLEDPIYKRVIIVLQGISDVGAEAYLEKDGWTLDSESLGALALEEHHDAKTLFEPDTGLLIVRFSRHLGRKPADAALAAHEAMHVVTFIFGGMFEHAFTTSSDEPLAYYMGWLVEAFLNGRPAVKRPKSKTRGKKLRLRKV